MARSRSTPVKSVSSAHAHPRPRRDRIPFRADVVAVQRVADLQAKGVARAEAARDDAAVEDRVPQRSRLVGHARELDALLARVAGPVHHHFDAGHLAHRPSERLGTLEAEALESARALHREQRVLVGDVTYVGTAQLALLEPLEHRACVRRIRDDQVPVPVEPVEDDVVDDPSALVRDERVLRVTGLEPVDVVGERRLQQVTRSRPLDFQLAHVRDVEDARVGSHRLVLRDDALVLDRHLPPRERDHPRAERDVAIMERRPAQRLHPRAMLTV